MMPTINAEKEDIERAWLYKKMLTVAHSAAKKGLLPNAIETEKDFLCASDDLIYDRFGPGFSDRSFSWHVDADERDGRLISVVAYFSNPSDFVGGDLEIELSSGIQKVSGCECGAAIAFLSNKLRHRVTKVTEGQRRSCLLLTRYK
eukprot:g3361.t1